METKPQDFYREIKDAILNQWEKNRVKIKELFEKIELNCNINVENEKEEMSFSFEHYELYYGSHESMRKDSTENNSNFLSVSNKKISEEEKNIRRLKSIEPSTLFYLIKKKKEIMNFVTSVTQYILFSISRLYYDMDYYSIIISSLQFKIFYAIMYYIDSTKDKKANLTETEKIKQKKVFHLINHFIHLALSFNKSIQTGKIASDNSSLNSLSKYILNNFIEITSKCQGLKIPKFIHRFKEPTLSQIKYKTKFYKCYLSRYKKYKDNSLLRIFMLYYNSKMTFWKSIILIAKPKDDKKTFICRTCEKEIPLEDIFLHLGCCKEQQSFYGKMNFFKLKIQKYITQLDIYLVKSNINKTPVNKKLFEKRGYLYNIICRIPGCENDYDGANFIKKLIKIYSHEKNKPNDYYEKRPEDISYIVSMTYFSLMVFLLNNISMETDQDLSEILGGIFCTLLQMFMNVQFILFVKKSQTKNIMIKNKRKKLINNSENSNESKNNNIIIFSEGKNKSNPNIIKLDNSSDDEDFFNPELNFKTTIQKYKLKLSLNNMMFVNNSYNKSKSKTKGRALRLKSPNNNISKISSATKKLDEINFFDKKSKSLMNNKKERRSNIQNSSTKREIISNINNNKNTKCKFHKRANSGEEFSTSKLTLNNKNFFKLNTLNYRTTGMRSLKMTRNNSSGNLLSQKKIEKYNKKYNILLKDKDKSNEGSIGLIMNISGTGTNLINASMISESESSGDFESVNKANLLRIDSNSNLSRVDSYLSRIDSNIHRLDSNISRIDSLENYKNEEENNLNCQNNDNFILNNHQNFQLGYRGDQSKKNLNKLSLFKKLPEEKIDVNVKNQTLFKKNKDEKENKENNSEEESNKESSELDDEKSLSSSEEGQNILVHEFEEEEELNDNKNEDDKNKKKIKKDKKEKNKKEDKDEEDDDFFTKSNKKNDENNKEINNEYENNIIIHSSNYSDSNESSESSESSNSNMFTENRITIKDYEEILPNMIYKKPGSQNNINYELISDLFNDMMEEIDEKNNLSNTITKDKDFFLKRNKFDLNNICPNDSTNVSSIKTNNLDDKSISDINPMKDINLSKIKDKNENNIKISKFKLILPIAKGGYGSVGLYKNMATSDTYAIKIVDINSMKEKKLSSSLKNEQNILREINNDYVVNSYFIFQDKKNYYFVMEYLPGGDVYTLLSKNNLPKKTIQLIVAETILAVNYLHGIGIIHHDIKPENILISLKGHFKLSDFGLSKTLQENNEFNVVKTLKNFAEFNKFPNNFNLGDDEDETKDAVGTLNYMAPELFTDKFPHGGGIDYWAIGVLIFDLYSYSLPFEAQTQEELRKNIIKINIDWIKLINDDVKKIYGNIEPAVDLIKKFLRENPEDRWGDKNLEEIKNHKFFEGFNWENVQNIKNETIKEYVKQRVKEHNNKIKQLNLKNKTKKEKGGENNENKTEDGYSNIIEINLTESEEKYLFTERYDNLSKKNNELIKKKIEKEVNFKENMSELMLLDLE